MSRVAEETYVNSKWQHEKSGQAEAVQTTANISCPLTEALVGRSAAGKSLLGVTVAGPKR